MSAAKRFFALDLGMQTVGLTEFHTLPDGGLALAGFYETELIVDPAADATRSEQLKLAVEELKQTAGFKKGDTVNFCLPSQSVFTRFVKLPGATAEDVRDVISFEAQQNVPFPIDEVVWDYQIMGEARDGNWDVVLVAIKSDQLNEINNSVQASGLLTDKIDVAPMALYNAYRFNYSEYTGTTMLVDIGARTTNLIFINGDKVFSRSIPIGGSAITSAVAKEIEGEMILAERLKKDKGFVGLGGSYAEPDDATEAKISKLVRNTLTRLHAEIARSISFYRANQGGAQPVRALLCGGTVSLPYMVEFFNEKLQMPVEFFNPLRNITVANEAAAEAVQSKVHRLGEVVGLGLRSAGSCPIEINLRPPSLVRQQSLKRRQPFLVAASICLALGIVSVGLYYSQAAKLQETVNSGIAAERSSLEGIAAQMDAALAERKKLEELVAPLLLANDERFLWATVMDELGRTLPERYIWLTQMTPLSDGRPVEFGDGKPIAVRAGGPGGTGPATPQQRQDRQPANVIDAIEIRGLYLDNPQMANVVTDFVKNLANSPLFGIDAENTSSIIRQRNTPDDQTWAYSFQLVVPLKTPLALQ